MDFLEDKSAKLQEEMEACRSKGRYLTGKQVEVEAEKLAMVADMGKAIPGNDMELETLSQDPLDVQLEAIKGDVGKEVLDMFEKFREL